MITPTWENFIPIGIWKKLSSVLSLEGWWNSAGSVHWYHHCDQDIQCLVTLRDTRLNTNADSVWITQISNNTACAGLCWTSFMFLPRYEHLIQNWKDYNHNLHRASNDENGNKENSAKSVKHLVQTWKNSCMQATPNKSEMHDCHDIYSFHCLGLLVSTNTWNTTTNDLKCICTKKKHIRITVHSNHSHVSHNLHVLEK